MGPTIVEGGREDNQVLTLNSFFRTITATILVGEESDRPLVIVQGGIKQILDSSSEGITTNAAVVATAMVASAIVATAMVATAMVASAMVASAMVATAMVDTAMEALVTTTVATAMEVPATTMVATATITEDTAVVAKDVSAPN